MCAALWTTPSLRLGRVVTGTSRLPAPLEPNPALLQPPLPSQCPTESREGILPHPVLCKWKQGQLADYVFSKYEWWKNNSGMCATRITQYHHKPLDLHCVCYLHKKLQFASVEVVMMRRVVCLFIQLHTAVLRLIVRSWLDVPTFATRRLHTRAPSSGRWNCGREVSGNFA